MLQKTALRVFACRLDPSRPSAERCRHASVVNFASLERKHTGELARYERSCLCENSSDSCFRPAEYVGDVQCCYIKSTCLELAPSPREDKTLIQHPSRMAMAEARPLNRLDSARSNLKLSSRNSSSIEKMRSIPKDGSMTPGVKAFTVTSSGQPGCEDIYRNPEESFPVLTPNA